LDFGVTELALATIAFEAPLLIAEQHRLFDKYLEDDFTLTVYDNTGRLHHQGLNRAAEDLLAGDAPYFGFLDHDVFPTTPTSLIPLIEETGFYGVGQRHAPTGHLYLWPGFCFFSREWLNGRPLDFEGIRGQHAKDDGDTGSGLWPLFVLEDWQKMYRPEHGYRVIREPDAYGLQSYGYETIGDFVHLTNGSHWMRVPDAEGRDRILFQMLAEL
jgi:hypothetical protein